MRNVELTTRRTAERVLERAWRLLLHHGDISCSFLSLLWESVLKKCINDLFDEERPRDRALDWRNGMPLSNPTAVVLIGLCEGKSVLVALGRTIGSYHFKIWVHLIHKNNVVSAPRVGS